MATNLRISLKNVCGFKSRSHIQGRTAHNIECRGRLRGRRHEAHRVLCGRLGFGFGILRLQSMAQPPADSRAEWSTTGRAAGGRPGHDRVGEPHRRSTVDDHERRWQLRLQPVAGRRLLGGGGVWSATRRRPPIVPVRLDRTASVTLRMVPVTFSSEIEVGARCRSSMPPAPTLGEVFDEKYLQQTTIGGDGRFYVEIMSQAAGVAPAGTHEVFASDHFRERLPRRRIQHHRPQHRRLAPSSAFRRRRGGERADRRAGRRVRLRHRRGHQRGHQVGRQPASPAPSTPATATRVSTSPESTTTRTSTSPPAASSPPPWAGRSCATACGSSRLRKRAR